VNLVEKLGDKLKQLVCSQNKESRIFIALLTVLCIALAILAVLSLGFVHSLAGARGVADSGGRNDGAGAADSGGRGDGAGAADNGGRNAGAGAADSGGRVAGAGAADSGGRGDGAGVADSGGRGDGAGVADSGRRNAGAGAADSGGSADGAGVAYYRGMIVFVIDDAGNNLYELEPFLRFPGPLTIAVLPGLPESAEAARRIRAAGKEVFLHQPMEAIGGEDPGPGAVYTGMSADEIRAVVERNLDEIGPVAGMNNHQGSKITMNEEAMETILSICRERGIFFLDSRTTAETVAPLVARRNNMSIGERDIFLDNIQDRASMIAYAREGLQKADRYGKAVMIGHTWSPELAGVLSELHPLIIAEGYALSTMSNLPGIP
jgi:polysaccharide deacetylase 2 family uncharacterized protein YibQ